MQGAMVVTPISSQDKMDNQTWTQTSTNLYIEELDRDDGSAFDVGSIEESDFEVTWDGPADPKNPQNWSTSTKCQVLFVVSFQSMLVIFYSTCFLAGAPGIMKELQIHSKTIVTLGMTTYMFGLATGPLLLAPLSEVFGRKSVFVFSLGMFFILVLPACLAENFYTILIIRFLGAFVGSVSVSNSPGSLSDIFSEEYRSLALSIHYLAPMNGPALGPLVGGFVFEYLGWRWTNWIVFIGSGVGWIMALFMPETYTPTLLRRKAEKVRRGTGDERHRSRFCPKAGTTGSSGGGVRVLLSKPFWSQIRTNVARPIVMAVTEPICIFWEIYIGVIYAILYLSFVGYPIVFTELRSWSPGASGLAFLGIGTGTVIAIALDPLNRKIYQMHKIDPKTGKRSSEARIAILCLAAIISPLAVFWFAWTCYPTTIHWYWPVLSGVPFGIGNTLIFIHGTNYLVDSYDIYAASALAGNMVVRSLAGGILPLFGTKMYEKLGPNWAETLVGCISIALIPIPFGFYKWGRHMRKRSPMLQRLQSEKEAAEKRMQMKEQKADGAKELAMVQEIVKAHLKGEV